jgi:hypothetical protein
VWQPPSQGDAQPAPDGYVIFRHTGGGCLNPNRINERRVTVALDLYSPLKVVSWASAHADCPMRYTITNADEVVITFGSGSNEFELSLDAGALSALAHIGTEALTKVNTRAEKRPGELMPVGERT